MELKINNAGIKKSPTQFYVLGIGVEINCLGYGRDIPFAFRHICCVSKKEVPKGKI
jgi:hypothetical protein